MFLVMFSVALAIAVAAIRMGWLRARDITRVLWWMGTAVSTGVVLLVVRAFEQRGYSRSLFALLGIALLVAGATIAREKVARPKGDADATQSVMLPFNLLAISDDCSRSSEQRVMWGFMGLLAVSLIVGSVALRHTGELAEVDAGTNDVVGFVLGSRLQPPFTVDVLREGSCFRHLAPGWPNPLEG